MAFDSAIEWTECMWNPVQASLAIAGDRLYILAANGGSHEKGSYLL